MPHIEDQERKKKQIAAEIQRAENHDVFKYREDHPAYHHGDPLRKRSHKEADKLAKKEAKLESRISSLERKLKKERNEDARWKIELQLKKEKLQLALVSLQEKQKRMTVLPEQLAVKTKVEMDGLKQIIDLRRELIGHYAECGVLSAEQETEIQKQQEALQSEIPHFERTTRLHEQQVSLVRAETRAREEMEGKRYSEIIDEFRTLRLTEQDMDEERIRENPEHYIRIAHLIRKMKQVPNLHRYETNVEVRRALREKLADLKDYQNYIREVFRKEGIDIFTWDLHFSHTAEQLGKRLTFLAGRKHRLKRFYASRSWNQDQMDAEEKRRKEEQEREERGKTGLEQRLSFLEEELQLQQDPEFKIAKTIWRPIDKAEENETDPIVKADLMDTIGTMNRLYEKYRLAQIFYAIKKKSGDPKLKELGNKLLFYLKLARQPGEDRFKFEDREQEALQLAMKEFQKTIAQVEGETKRQLNMLYSLMNDNVDGELEVPENAELRVFDDSRFRLNPFGFEALVYRKKWKDRRKDPLFPHSPTIKDISQGGARDCYLMAGLAAVLSLHPEAIRKCMKDNGDGTVTVRFYHRDEARRRQEPRYYTVTKTTVCDAYTGEDVYAEGSLWVQMMEKAYLASGLPHNSTMEEQNRDENHKIHFDELSSGVAQNFVSQLIGSEFEGMRMNDLDKGLYDTIQDERREKEIQKQNRNENENPNQEPEDLYTASENSVYEDINNSLRREEYVFYSARNKFKGFFHGVSVTGEEIEHGLASNHAYAVLGTKTRKINGKKHKFILIMNPWANRERVYRVDRNKDFGKAKGVEGEPEEGIMLLDLRDFIDCGSMYRTMPSD